MKKNRKKIYRPADCLLCGKDNSNTTNLHIGLFIDNDSEITLYSLCDVCFLKPDKRDLAEVNIQVLKKRGVL